MCCTILRGLLAICVPNCSQLIVQNTYLCVTFLCFVHSFAQRQRSKTDLAGFVEGGDEGVEPSYGDNLGKLFLLG